MKQKEDRTYGNKSIRVFEIKEGYARISGRVGFVLPEKTKPAGAASVYDPVVDFGLEYFINFCISED